MTKIKIPKQELVPRNKLIVDKTNPNVMDEKSYQALKDVIEKFGFIIPIITNKNYVIADGFHRFKAARDLNIETVPVIALDVDEVDRKILRQVLNKLHGEHKLGKDIEEFEFIYDQQKSYDSLVKYLGKDDSYFKDLVELKEEEVEDGIERIKEEEYFTSINDYLEWQKIKKLLGDD